MIIQFKIKLSDSALCLSLLYPIHTHLKLIVAWLSVHQHAYVGRVAMAGQPDSAVLFHIEAHGLKFTKTIYRIALEYHGTFFTDS